MEYTIKFWEDEEMREMGESSTHIPTSDNKNDVIEEAKKLFYRMDYPAVEVEDENGEVVFHISVDVPDGEEY